MSAHDQVIQDVYAREVVMARVGHLIRRKQQEIERITRILRNSVPFEEAAVPVEGKIQKIVLIGPYARRTWYEDRASLYFSDYEFWVIVNHRTSQTISTGPRSRRSSIVNSGIVAQYP